MPFVVHWAVLTLWVMAGIFVVKSLVLATPLKNVPGLSNVVATV